MWGGCVGGGGQSRRGREESEEEGNKNQSRNWHTPNAMCASKLPYIFQDTVN